MRFSLLEIFKARSTSNKYDVPVANFDVVVPGRLYRGARFAPEILPLVKAKFGMKTLVDLIRAEEAEDVEAERAACAENQVTLEMLPMSDREPPDEATILTWLGIMRSPENWPVYMHCVAGVHRTGLLCAVYRVADCGFTKEAAWKEAEDRHFWSFMGIDGHQKLEQWFLRDFDPSKFEAKTN